MKQLRRFCGAPCCLMGERCTPLFTCQTRLAKLLHLLQHRQPADHLLLAHPPESSEPSVAKPSMPPPRLITSARCQAHRPSNAKLEHVQACRSSQYPCKQPSILLTNLHDTSVNFYLMAVFVQLPNTDDVCVEARNEVDIWEHTMFAGLALVQDCPPAFNLNDRPVPEVHSPGCPHVDAGKRCPGPRHVI
jgi:hypothetical protein